MTFLSKPRDERNHDHAVEDGDTGKRDETNTGGNGKRQTTQPKRENSAGQRQRHTGVNEQRIFDVAERHEEKRENQSQREWHNHSQTFGGGLQLFKLSAPPEPIAWRNLHFIGHRTLRVRDKRAEIAPAHVARHSDDALAILTTDLVRHLLHLQIRNVAKCDEGWRRRSKVECLIGMITLW